LGLAEDDVFNWPGPLEIVRSCLGACRKSGHVLGQEGGGAVIAGLRYGEHDDAYLQSARHRRHLPALRRHRRFGLLRRWLQTVREDPVRPAALAVPVGQEGL